MRNSVINLFAQGKSFRLRAVIILIIAIVVFLFGKTIKRQEVKLIKLHQELKQAKEMVAQIPELEAKLKALQEQVIILQSRPQNVNFVLNGIFIKDKVPVALIGGNICNENDSIGGFTILKITLNSVILKNNRTQEQKTIYISE